MNSTNERKSTLNTQNHNNSLQLKDFLSPRTLDRDSTLTIDEKNKPKMKTQAPNFSSEGGGLILVSVIKVAQFQGPWLSRLGTMYDNLQK